MFDLDGVLVDTEVISREASDRVLKEVGISQTDEERKKVFGRRTFENYKAAIEARGLDIDPQKLVDKKNELFKKMIKGRLKPLPGIGKLLASLKEAGYKLAVVSSSPEGRVYATLDEVKLTDKFDAIVTGDCCVKGKPNPEPFRVAAKRIGVRPSECVVVEDAEIGVEAAKAAGMKVIAVKSPNTFGQNLNKADMILDGTEKLTLRILGGM